MNLKNLEDLNLDSHDFQVLKRSELDFNNILEICNDNDLIRSISGRFGNNNNSKIEKQIKNYSGVALCIEELCPGGFDATDGIEWALKIEELGADFLIITSGTEDFPALKHRRKTQSSHSDLEESYEIEPWLASGIWVLGRLKVPIFAMGAPNNLKHAKKLAQKLGYAGLILED